MGDQSLESLMIFLPFLPFALGCEIVNTFWCLRGKDVEIFRGFVGFVKRNAQKSLLQALNRHFAQDPEEQERVRKAFMAAKEAADKAKKTIEVFRLQSLFKSCCRSFTKFVYLNEMNELNGRLPHIIHILPQYVITLGP